MHDSIPELSRLDPLTLFALSGAMQAASATGIFEKVLASPCTAAECAQQLGLTEHIVACVLEILAAGGIIEKNGGIFGLLAEPPLSKLHSRHSLLGLKQHFDATTEVLRTATPALWLDGTSTQREITYRQWAADMGDLFADAARYLAERLPGIPEKILDVGCGSGVWSLELAARHPGAHVTGLDLPLVLDAFANRAARMGLQGRITCLPGDMWQIEWRPADYDLIIIANVLRLEPAANAERLIARAAAALRPGGQLVIVDALAGGTPNRELARAAYALHLGLRTRLGGVHSPWQIREWLQNVGITDIASIDCGIQIAAIGALAGIKTG